MRSFLWTLGQKKTESSSCLMRFGRILSSAARLSRTRPVAFRPCLTAGLAFFFNEEQ